MKTYILFLLAVSTASCQTYKFTIPANDRIELTYPQFDQYDATIDNKSNNEIEVAVISSDSEVPVRGFGLNKKSNAEVMVEGSNRLTLINNSNEDANITVRISESKAPKVSSKKEYVNLTLRNNSAKSIPLIIPTVMNPNLSPFSNSGVSLKIGQEIFFKQGGKRYVLLTIDDSYNDGDVVDIANKLKERKKELGL